MADDVEKIRYNLAVFRFNKTDIRTDTFSVTISQEATKYTASSSHYPYAMAFSGESLEWELTDVDPEHRAFFVEQMDNQRKEPHHLPSISTYDMDGNGNVVPDDVFTNAYITEIEKENANKPFTVKGEALRRQSRSQIR